MRGNFPHKLAPRLAEPAVDNRCTDVPRGRRARREYENRVNALASTAGP
jgi:hypothetical protein